MEKEQLLKNLREEFKEIKKRLGFKSSFKDLNDIFSIEEMVLQEGYVFPSLNRKLSRRIVDIYKSWLNYACSLMNPSPDNILILMESKMLGQEDKKKISNIIKKISSLISSNNLIALTKDEKLETKFIDDAVQFWNNYFKIEMIKILEKIKEGWDEDKSE